MSLYEFLDKHSIYIVLIIALIIWFGVFGYLLKLNSKLKKIEKLVFEDKNKEEVEK